MDFREQGSAANLNKATPTLDCSTMGDKAAQAYVDACTAEESSFLNLDRFPLLTRIPRRIPSHKKHVRLKGCTLLTSTAGLPHGVQRVTLTGCTALKSVSGLPHSVRAVSVTGCISLETLGGLPSWSVAEVAFIDCPSLTSLVGLPDGVGTALFHGCTSLTSSCGLPDSLMWVRFSGCPSLSKVAQLPRRLNYLNFDNCEGLKSVADIRSKFIANISFTNCVSLTRVLLPYSVRRARFFACPTLASVVSLSPKQHSIPRLVRFVGTYHRLRRRHHGGVSFSMEQRGDDPASEVRRIMRSGACGDQMLKHIGPDVALLVGCFATAGLNSSPQFQDRMETREQVLTRYHMERTKEIDGFYGYKRLLEL